MHLERRTPNSICSKPFLALLLLGFAGCGGSGDGGGGGGGAAGVGGQGQAGAGSCAAPFDFLSLQQYQGSLPFVHGTIEGQQAEHRGSCGGSAEEAVYRWVAPRDGAVRLGILIDTPNFVFYVRTECADPATELHCVRGASPKILHVKEGEVYYLFADSEGAEPEYDLALEFLPTDLQIGERCSQKLGFCGEGLFCDQREGRCASSVPPTLEEGKAHWHAVKQGEARFWVRGTAPSKNVEGLYYRFKDETGAIVPVLGSDPPQLELAGTFEPSVYGQEEFSGGNWANMAMLFPTAVAVEIEAVDAAGGRSNTLSLDILPAPIRQLDEDCDPEAFFGACDEALFCQGHFQDPPLCEEGVAPTLHTAVFLIHRSGSSASVQVQGEDPNGDVSHSIVTFLDEEGAPVEAPGVDAVGRMELPLPRLSGANPYDGFTQAIYRLPLETIHEVRVQVVDSLGLKSEVVVAEIKKDEPIE